MGIQLFFVQHKTGRVSAAILKMVSVWLVLFIGGCAWLDQQQKLIIYRPTPSLEVRPSALPSVTKSYFLDTCERGAPAHIGVWWLAQPQADAPALLYLHGTFRNLQGNQRKIAALYAAGFSVLALDYRGWGASTYIIPSEQTIVQDARVAWMELVRRQPHAASRVIYGHSMGSAVAVSLASNLAYPSDYGGLILESAFTSFDDVAKEAGFLAGVLQRFGTEHFTAIDQIGQIHAPVLMLHGELDDTIPIRLGQRLFDAANEPKQWQTIAGGHHSDLDDMGREPYQRALRTFKTTYLGQEPAPQAPESEAQALQPQ